MQSIGGMVLLLYPVALPIGRSLNLRTPKVLFQLFSSMEKLACWVSAAKQLHHSMQTVWSLLQQVRLQIYLKLHWKEKQTLANHPRECM